MKLLNYTLIAVTTLLFTSCITTKKAVDFLKEKGELAEVCAEEYPVVSKTDSALFIKTKAEFDSIAALLEERLSLSTNENESLYELINRLMQDSTLECDSLVDAVYKYSATQVSKTIELQKQVSALKAASKNVKPIVITERDRAYEGVLMDANVAIEKKLGQVEIKAGALEDEKAALQEKVKSKNTKIFWLYVIIALLTAWILRRPIAKLINPIRAIIPF